MSINRLFRRYTRVLLMVVMSLLLVAFLLGDVISSFRNESFNVVSGEAFGEPFETSDIMASASVVRVMDAFGLRRPRMDEIHMFLLLEEARRMGVRVSSAEIAASVDARAVASLRDQLGISTDRIHELLAQGLGLDRALAVQSEALLLSTPRAQNAYRNETQTVDVKLSVIDARAFLPRVAEPTDEQLAALFEEGKDRITEHTEEVLRFGYRVPDRVQVEYLTVDPQEAKRRMRVSPRDIEQHYNRNKSRYFRTVPKLALPETTQPARSQFERIQMTLEEVRPRVEAEVRDAKAMRETQRLINRIQRRARRPWLSAALGDDNFLLAPADAADVSFEALAKKFTEALEVKYVKTALLDRTALAAEPGLGRVSSSGAGGRSLTFADLALKVKGLATSAKDDAVRGLNLFEPSSVLFTRKVVGRSFVPYQAYFFRVIALVPSAPPASLEDVRQRLLDDLKLSKAYALAGETAQRLAQRARTIGLEDAAGSDESLKALMAAADLEDRPPLPGDAPVPPPVGRHTRSLGPFEPTSKITRNTQSILRVGRSETLAEKLFEAAAAATADGERRVIVVSLAQQQKWVVVEIGEVSKLYEDDFAAWREGRREFSLLQNEFFGVYEGWYDADNLEARAGYKPAGDQDQ